MDCSPPGSSVYGTLEARILGWVAISFSRGSSQPRDQRDASPAFPALAGGFFTIEPRGKPPDLGQGFSPSTLLAFGGQLTLCCGGCPEYL